MPCTDGSALSASTCARRSACDVSSGNRMVTLRMPASSVALPLLRTYTALAGSSPTSTTVRPGTTPRWASRWASHATSSRIRRAIATPSISSAGKVHRPLLADHDHLDLAGILQLTLDATRDFLAQRRHANVVHVVGIHDHANLAPRLDREDLVHSGVARGDPFQTLEPLHVGLERFAPRARTGARDRVRRLYEHRHFALVRHVVMVCRNAVHDERVLRSEE